MECFPSRADANISPTTFNRVIISSGHGLIALTASNPINPARVSLHTIGILMSERMFCASHLVLSAVASGGSWNTSGT